MRRRGLSLVEALIGVFIIGVSVLSILELIRSGTSSLEVTEAEAAARQLGADLLRRITGPRQGPDFDISDTLKALLGQPARWSDVVANDPALAHGFPTKELGSLLDSADVRLQLEIEPSTHAALGGAKDVAAVKVTVYFTDRNERNKRVTLARLVEL